MMDCFLTLWHSNKNKYAWFQCGQPNFTRPCPTCGAQIGGVGYTAAVGNERIMNL